MVVNIKPRIHIPELLKLNLIIKNTIPSSNPMMMLLLLYLASLYPIRYLQPYPTFISAAYGRYEIIMMAAAISFPGL